MLSIPIKSRACSASRLRVARTRATFVTWQSGREVVTRSGSWRLHADPSGNLNTQIGALLTKLPSDPTIWRELTDHYECDVFCGLFMRDGNAGMELSPEVMSMLGVRGLRLGLDIYGGSD